MDQENVVHTHNGVLVTRNNDMRLEGKWMQLEDTMLSEISQDQTHKSCMFSLVRGR
jgi:hypothetical protein